MKALDRKKALKVIIISLLLDLLAFTIILPLFPRLLRMYDETEPENSLYRSIARIITGLRENVSGEKRLDIILFGGLVGSLYSFLQFLAAPTIGKLSDIYGRRTVLLWSMVGNAVSLLLWMFADRFEVFLVSRIVGGLSEGNVQALVGISFSIGFTIGPPLGAYLSSINLKTYFPSLPINSYSTPALFALILILVETWGMWRYLPETLRTGKKEVAKKARKGRVPQSLSFLSIIHFVFLFLFSGIEFTLTFLTFDRFAYTNVQQGKLLAFMGVLTSIVQGGFVRRCGGREKEMVLVGIAACAVGLYMIGHSAGGSEYLLFGGVALLSITSGTVVTSLTALASFEGGENKGSVLGGFRSVGQLGRCFGPMVACVGYWVLGGEAIYGVGSLGMFGVGIMGLYMIAGREKLKIE